jgi:glucan biosynthesis protein C
MNAVKERKYYIDWLRIIAMLTVFVFHCSRFFCTEDWHLKVPAAQQSEVLRIVRDMLIGVWFMELFFLVSGFAAWYALKRRTGGQFLGERVTRLLIPLYVVGMAILVVPQQYFEDLTHGRITATFWEWLPTYYLTIPGRLLTFWRHLSDPTALLPYTFSGHLWFIQMLFVVSLLTLPVLLFLRSERGGRLIERLAGWVARPGGAFLFLIPLASAQIALRWLPEDSGRTWAHFVWYALFFVIGYIIAADDRFIDAIKRCGAPCLALWIGSYLVVGSLLTFVFKYDPSTGLASPALYVVHKITWSVVSWSAVVFILGLGAKYLNRSNRLLVYGNEAVLPFYLFHQTVILIVGWFVLPWDIDNVAKYFIIAAVSFPAILLLYEVFVRRIGFMRVLFGMAPQKKPLAVAVAVG